MRNKFDEQLRTLNNEMISMGNMIQKAIQDTIDAFFSQNTVKARMIMKDDELVDREQKLIENICFQLLIQQQPVAKDLRTVTAAMKMVTDMERIGDHAADIAELTIVMSKSPFILNVEQVRRMSAETIVMLLSAVQAYVERDMEKAREVIDHDDVVDALFTEVKANLIKMMQNNPNNAEYAADLLMVSKYLERIGDHATNIAEWVIFSCSPENPQKNKDD